MASKDHSVSSEVQGSHSWPLVIAGSGPGVVATSLLVQAFERIHPDIRITLHGGIRSAATLRAVSDGLVDVGLLLRDSRDPDGAKGITVIPYAQTAIVCGVHPIVAEDEISSNDVVQIFQGEKTHWRDGHRIVMMTREPGDNSIQVLEQEVPGFMAAYQSSRLSRRSITLYSDQEMNRALARTPGALGFTDLELLTDHHFPIKVLRFNGIAPTPANVRKGLYPLVKVLAFAFVKEKLPDEAVTFLGFAQSRQGEKILESNGYLPISSEGLPAGRVEPGDITR